MFIWRKLNESRESTELPPSCRGAFVPRAIATQSDPLTDQQINIGHGRIEKLTVSICQSLQGIRHVQPPLKSHRYLILPNCTRQNA